MIIMEDYFELQVMQSSSSRILELKTKQKKNYEVDIIIKCHL